MAPEKSSAGGNSQDSFLQEVGQGLALQVVERTWLSREKQGGSAMLGERCEQGNGVRSGSGSAGAG